jgi:ribosome maturation factor RimP
MAASSPVDGVRALAAPAAASAGLVVENVTITPAGRRRVLRVTVDLPDDATGGVPMEAVAKASQALSEALDAGDVMGGTPYVLEVSSPGADRPLTERRHWLRARGRLVGVTLVDGRVVTGRLTDAGDTGLVVDGAPLPWADVRSGRIELEFARPEGDQPENDVTDDADAEDDTDDEEDEEDEDDLDDTDDEEGEV